jgi:hypothetical protein
MRSIIDISFFLRTNVILSILIITILISTNYFCDPAAAQEAESPKSPIKEKYILTDTNPIIMVVSYNNVDQSIIEQDIDIVLLPKYKKFYNLRNKSLIGYIIDGTWKIENSNLLSSFPPLVYVDCHVKGEIRISTCGVSDPDYGSYPGVSDEMSFDLAKYLNRKFTTQDKKP